MYVDNSTLNNVKTTAVIKHDISDHSPIAIAFQLGIDRKKLKISKSKSRIFLTDLAKQLRSSAAVQQNDISELIKIISNLTDKHFPKVQRFRTQYRKLKSITVQN